MNNCVPIAKCTAPKIIVTKMKWEANEQCSKGLG